MSLICLLEKVRVKGKGYEFLICPLEFQDY